MKSLTNLLSYMSRVVVFLLLGALSVATAAAPGFLSEIGDIRNYFIENRGQADPEVALVSMDGPVTTSFTSTGVVFELAEQTEGLASTTREGLSIGKLSAPLVVIPKTHTLTLSFIGANPYVVPVGTEPAPTKVNYLIGSEEEWVTGANTFYSVTYEDLWPGIDLVYSTKGDQMKYAFTVAPGADTSVIRLAYEGASDLLQLEDGRLEIVTPLGSIFDSAPYTYQQNGDTRIMVPSEFSLEQDENEFGFTLGDFDPTLPLIIDPSYLAYAGFSNTNARGLGIAVDSDNAAYITGHTNIVHGAMGFVQKVHPDGDHLEWHTNIGGLTFAFDIVVDDLHNSYITGAIYSHPYFDANDLFPKALGPDLTFNSPDDAMHTDSFVLKLDPTGQNTIFGGFVGGYEMEIGEGIVVDDEGDVYLTGGVESTEYTFPAVVGPDVTHNGLYDTYICKLKATQTVQSDPRNNYHYCGYIGGAGQDAMVTETWLTAGHVGIDETGAAYISGTTNSSEATFPNGQGFASVPDLPGYDHTFNGGDFDAYVAKVNPSGTGLDYITYIGGAESEGGFGMAITSDHRVFITGHTYSDEGTFPVTVGPDLTYNGKADAFIVQLDVSGTDLLSAGYLGGFWDDQGLAMTVDSDDNVYVAGYTESDESDFPVTGDYLDSTYNSPLTTDTSDLVMGDGFVGRILPDGSAWDGLGYIGGDHGDAIFWIVADAENNLYVVGDSSSLRLDAQDGLGCGILTSLGTTNSAGGRYNEDGSLMSTVFVAKISAEALPIVIPPDTTVITESTTLTGDHTGRLIIGADDVTLDCASHTVRHTVEQWEENIATVCAEGKSGLVIRNCVFGTYAGSLGRGYDLEVWKSPGTLIEDVYFERRMIDDGGLYDEHKGDMGLFLSPESVIRGGAGMDVFMTFSNNSTIEGMEQFQPYFSEPYYNTLYVNESSGVTIRNNSLAAVKLSAYKDPEGDSCRGLILEGNYIHNRMKLGYIGDWAIESVIRGNLSVAHSYPDGEYGDDKGYSYIRGNDNLIERNTFRSHGVYLTGTGNTLKGNAQLGPELWLGGLHGLHVTNDDYADPTADNTIESNSFIGNEGFGIFDETAGFGATNTYIWNMCKDNDLGSSFPDDLCESTDAMPFATDDLVVIDPSDANSVTIDVLANDIDPSGNGLTIDFISEPTYGSVEIVGGALVYIPDEGPVAMSDRILYAVTDGIYRSAVAEVTITSSNQAPVANFDGAATAPGTLVTVDVLANDTDEDGDMLTITQVTQPTSTAGMVINNGTDLTFIPEPGFTGSAEFHYAVSDGYGGTAYASVSVRVGLTCSQYQPELSIVPNTQTVPPGTSAAVYSVQVHINDTAECDPFTLDLAYSDSVDASLTPSSLDIVPGVFYAFDVPLELDSSTLTKGYYWFSVTATTPYYTVTRWAQLVVNTPPEANDDLAVTPWDSPVDIEVLANDVDPDGYSLEVTDFSQPSNGTVSVSGDWVEYPGYYVSGAALSWYFDFEPDQCKALCLTNEECVYVSWIDFSPDPTYCALWDDSATLYYSGNEIYMVYELVPGEPGILTYTPDDGWFGTDSFTYTASDGVDSDTATVTIEVVKAIHVDIDIQPNRTDNRIKVDESTTIPVAILSGPGFHSLLVEPSSIKFGPAGAAPIERMTRFKDVNGDGYVDNLLRFRVSETGIQCDDTEATLTGTHVSLQGEVNEIMGTDTFIVRRCKL